MQAEANPQQPSHGKAPKASNGRYPRRRRSIPSKRRLWSNKHMTPEQRRRNRIAGIVLAIIVIAIFAWTFLRGSTLMN